MALACTYIGSIRISNGIISTTSTHVNTALLSRKRYISRPYATNALMKSVSTVWHTVIRSELRNHRKYWCGRYAPSMVMPLNKYRQLFRLHISNCGLRLRPLRHSSAPPFIVPSRMATSGMRIKQAMAVKNTSRNSRAKGLYPRRLFRLFWARIAGAVMLCAPFRSRR